MMDWMLVTHMIYEILSMKNALDGIYCRLLFIAEEKAASAIKLFFI